MQTNLSGSICPPLDRTAERKSRRRKAKRRKRITRFVAFAFLLAVVLLTANKLNIRKIAATPSAAESGVAASEEKASQADKLHAIETDPEYPEVMAELAEKYPEAVDYVYDYPRLKDKTPDIDLSDEAAADAVPLLMQWDSRWGYAPYGSGLIGYTGCGPTSLSMAALYLTHDARWTPKKVAEIATENGYCVDGNGSSWTLISEGCQFVGLSARELPLDETVMKNALNDGTPIIVIVGPGDFTASGHFMVITGFDGSGFTLNDPNSRKNSDASWSYNRLSGQIRNMWAMSKK